MKFILKLLLKIILAPIMLVLAFIIWLCTLAMNISTVLLNIVSVIMVIAGIFQFVEYHRIGGGIACLVFAFLFSPYGLPMAAAWLIAQLMYFRDWLKETVYG